MPEKRSLEIVEVSGSIAWFAMDACWMLEARLGAVVLAVPTVLLGAVALRHGARSVASGLVDGAMVAWSCMNVLWMAHDFGLVAWGVTGGKVFLTLGAALVAAAVLVGRGATLRVLVARFRRLRWRA